MSRPKAKPMPVTLKKYVVRITQHLHDTAIATTFFNPPFSPEEIDEAKFNASEMHSSLRTGPNPDKASRVGHLSMVMAYQMSLNSLKHYAETIIAREAAPKAKATVPQEPTSTEPLTEAQLAAAAEILNVENIEEKQNAPQIS